MASNPAAPKANKVHGKVKETHTRHDMSLLSSSSESEAETSLPQNVRKSTALTTRGVDATAGEPFPLTLLASAATGSSAATASTKFVTPWAIERISKEDYWNRLELNWNMIEISDKAINAVASSKTCGATRLKSVNGIPIVRISHRPSMHIIIRGLNLTITGMTRMPKKELCDEIAIYKELHDASYDAASDDDELLANTLTSTKVDKHPIKRTAPMTNANFTRLINVLSSDVLKPEWDKKASKKPSRLLIEDKQKTGGRFFRILTEEYNSTNPEYDRTDKYSTEELTDCQILQDGSDFRVMSEKQIKAAFNSLNKIYKESVANSQVSGMHDEYRCINYHDFIQERPYLLYYHGFMMEVGCNIKNTSLVELPDGVFGESSGGQAQSSSAPAPMLPRPKKATPPSAADQHLATIAATSKERLVVFKRSSDIQVHAEVVKLEATTKDARDQAAANELAHRRTLRQALENKHGTKSKGEIKSREASLIKRAAAEEDGLSLSQATYCSTDTINTIGTIGIAAKQVARFSKEKLTFDTRLQGYSQQLSSLMGTAQKDDKGYDSESTQPTPKKRPPKKRRAVWADVPEWDSDA